MNENPVKYVNVLDKQGNQLMPCKPAVCRHLLRDKKAKIVNHSKDNFTIQMTVNTTHYIQPDILSKRIDNQKSDDNE